MNRAALAVAGVAGLMLARQANAAIRDSIDQAAGAITDGFSKVFNLLRMKAVDPTDLNNPNVRAFLRVIRAGEGTTDAGGYSRLYGGGAFSGFADHPRKTVCRMAGARRICSTAAGAYQLLSTTWDETRGYMGLADFSPGSQDLAALGRIAARGALDDVKAGRFEVAIKACAKEWASLPGSPYGQPTISLDRARQVYASAGGFNLGDMTA